MANSTNLDFLIFNFREERKVTLAGCAIEDTKSYVARDFFVTFLCFTSFKNPF
jgi:hypothetical protein